MHNRHITERAWPRAGNSTGVLTRGRCYPATCIFAPAASLVYPIKKGAQLTLHGHACAACALSIIMLCCFQLGAYRGDIERCTAQVDLRTSACVLTPVLSLNTALHYNPPARCPSLLISTHVPALIFVWTAGYRMSAELRTRLTLALYRTSLVQVRFQCAHKRATPVLRCDCML